MAGGHEFARGKRKKRLFVWGHQKSKSGELTSACFSQWWSAPFTVDGVCYRTAEHWMMARKSLLFGDREMFERILHAPTPGEAKALGRRVRGFDERIWREQRLAIVVEGNLHKFSQHPALKAFLQNTRACFGRGQSGRPDMGHWIERRARKHAKSRALEWPQPAGIRHDDRPGSLARRRPKAT
jgi:ribA/ribD-fused uncharacterized protein